MADPRLTGVLLVGGASTRFGSPKALATLDGVTLAEHAWRTLGAACGERLAVGKAADALDLPFPLIDDETPVRAPIAGVVRGLHEAGNERCVFLPVDCPLVTPGVLLELAGACETRDAAVPPSGPLPGCYRKTALPVLERRLADGRLALRDAVSALDAAIVELDPSLLVNVNRSEDLDHFRR